jgi:tetratricopeptide (TPR) repeat protein
MRAWVTPLNPFILLYLSMALLAFAISPLPAYSRPYLIQVAGGAIAFGVASAWLNQPARLRQLCYALVLAGGGLALLGLFTVQWPTQYLFDVRPALAYIPDLALPIAIHSNSMAAILLLPLGLAGGVWQFALSRWQRVGLGTAVFLMALLFLLTQSRNAWLALLVAGMAYWAWGRFRFAYAAVGLGALLALPLLINLLPPQPLAYLKGGVNVVDAATKSGLTKDPSWLARLEIWQTAGQMLADYPVLGAGLYTFDPISRANYVYAVVPPQLYFAHTHHLVAHTAVSLGPLGALALLGLWGMVLWGLWQQRPQWEPDGVNLAAVLGATFIGYFWFNLFDVLGLEMKAGLLTWLYLAVAVRLSPAPNWPYTGRKTAVAVGVILAMWLALLVSPLGQQNWARLQLDQSRFAPSRPLAVAPEQFAGDARRMGLVYWELGEVETAVAIWQTDPHNVSFLRQQGMAAYLDGEWATAIIWFQLALRLDENDGLTHYWLGLANQYTQGNPAQARTHYDLALAALHQTGSPQLLADIWQERGRVSAQMGDWLGAADAFAQAAVLFPQNPDYAAQLEQINQLLRQLNPEP